MADEFPLLQFLVWQLGSATLSSVAKIDKGDYSVLIRCGGRTLSMVDKRALDFDFSKTLCSHPGALTYRRCAR